jgi:thymidylate synthase (FAD)
MRWKAVRKEALRRANWKCEHCGRVVTGKYEARVDHKIPVSEDLSRAYDLSNLRVLCVDCDAMRHRSKGGAGRADGLAKVAIGKDGWPIIDDNSDDTHDEV